MSKKRANRKKIFEKHGLRSGLELLILKALRTLQRATGFALGYETAWFAYTLSRRYRPDFTITLANGRVFYLEVKGYLRPSDRTKLRAVKRDNPGMDLRIVFGKDQPLNKSTDTLYSEWALKNGFEFAIGEVPKEWFISEQP